MVVSTTSSDPPWDFAAAISLLHLPLGSITSAASLQEEAQTSVPVVAEFAKGLEDHIITQSSLGNFDLIWTTLGQSLHIPPPVVPVSISTGDEVEESVSNETSSSSLSSFTEITSKESFYQHALHQNEVKVCNTMKWFKRKGQSRAAKKALQEQEISAEETEQLDLIDELDINRVIAQKSAICTSQKVEKLQLNEEPETKRIQRSRVIQQLLYSDRKDFSHDHEPTTAYKSSPYKSSPFMQLPSKNSGLAQASIRKQRLLEMLHERFSKEQSMLANYKHTPFPPMIPQGIHIFVDMSNVGHTSSAVSILLTMARFSLDSMTPTN